MNREIEKIIELFDKGYCNECNELNCLGGEPSSRKVANCIRNLYKALLDIKEYIEKNIDNEFVHNWYLTNEEAHKLLDIVNKAIGGKE